MSAPCAIFDLDGTLAHTAPDLVGTANDLFTERGFAPMPLSIAETTAGFGGKALIRAAFAHAGHPVDEREVDALYQPFLDRYAERICDESRLYDGVIDTLDALETQGWIVGVCTNKPEGLARTLLERLDVLHRFAALVGADTLPVRKPDPVALLTTIERCGATAHLSVMIGDTDTDRETARNADIPCIMTRFGSGSGQLRGDAGRAGSGAAAVRPTLPPA
jgi:phosphoglycolate phosphatase